MNKSLCQESQSASPRDGIRAGMFLTAAWLCLMMTMLLSSLQAQDRSASSTATPERAREENLPFDRDQYLSAFNQVWETVRDTHWDDELIQSVWLPAKEKYVNRISQSESREAATTVLQEMLSELKQSHFQIIPAEAYNTIDTIADQGGEGWSGITLRAIDNRVVVTKVAADSPASDAGIQVGWILERIHRPAQKEPVTVSRLFEAAEKISRMDASRRETLLVYLSMGLISGDLGEALNLTFLDNSDQPRNVTIQLKRGPGQLARLGHLPASYVTFEYRQLPDQVGYIHFNAFLDAPRLIKEYEAALFHEHNSRGIIIDLRGNFGGLILLAVGMSGWLVDEPHSLGWMQSKANTLKLTINPRRPRFRKPVAILVDECSVSCAELFPGGLQELKAARIFGSRTAGQVIPSQVVKLPTGDGFQYATAELKSESGEVWEGNGVQPDEPIVLTRTMLQHDPDPVLTAALQWLAEEAR